jgi:hypothetical protein
LELHGRFAMESGERAYLTDAENACEVKIRCNDYVGGCMKAWDIDYGGTLRGAWEDFGTEPNTGAN